jgi:hypothetical protein
MSKVRHSAPISLAAFCERTCGNEKRCNEAGPQQKDAHGDGSGPKQLAGVPDASLNVISLDQRHYGHAGLKSRKTQRQLGKQYEADPDDPEDAVMGCEYGGLPTGEELGMVEEHAPGNDCHDRIEQQVDGDKHNRNPDCLLKSS